MEAYLSCNQNGILSHRPKIFASTWLCTPTTWAWVLHWSSAMTKYSPFAETRRLHTGRMVPGKRYLHMLSIHAKAQKGAVLLTMNEHWKDTDGDASTLPLHPSNDRVMTCLLSYYERHKAFLRDSMALLKREELRTDHTFRTGPSSRWVLLCCPHLCNHPRQVGTVGTMKE